MTCVDKDPQRLAELKGGKSPIYEPGLDDLLQRNMQAGRLLFTDDLGAASKNADVILLAVGTPMRRGDGYATSPTSTRRSTRSPRTSPASPSS